jgi:hypothetical protein
MLSPLGGPPAFVDHTPPIPNCRVARHWLSLSSPPILNRRVAGRRADLPSHMPTKTDPTVGWPEFGPPTVAQGGNRKKWELDERKSKNETDMMTDQTGGPIRPRNRTEQTGETVDHYTTGDSHQWNLTGEWPGVKAMEGKIPPVRLTSGFPATPVPALSASDTRPIALSAEAGMVLISRCPMVLLPSRTLLLSSFQSLFNELLCALFWYF